MRLLFQHNSLCARREEREGKEGGEEGGGGEGFTVYNNLGVCINKGYLWLGLREGTDLLMYLILSLCSGRAGLVVIAEWGKGGGGGGGGGGGRGGGRGCVQGDEVGSVSG